MEWFEVLFYFRHVQIDEYFESETYYTAERSLKIFVFKFKFREWFFLLFVQMYLLLIIN